MRQSSSYCCRGVVTAVGTTGGGAGWDPDGVACSESAGGVSVFIWIWSAEFSLDFLAVWEFNVVVVLLTEKKVKIVK